MSFSKEEFQLPKILRNLLHDHLGNLRKIKFPVHFASHSTKRWNSLLNQIITETENKINFLDNPEVIIDAVSKMEKKLGGLINSVLDELDKDKLLGKHAPKLKTLGSINKEMASINISLAHHVENIIKFGLESNPKIQFWKNMSDVQKKTKINTSLLPPSIRHNDAAKQNIQKFLEIGRSMVLLALLKEGKTELGSNLLEGLNNEHSLGISVSFTSDARECMTVTPEGKQAFAKINNEPLMQDSFDQLSSQRVENNTGSGSILNIPVIITEENCYQILDDKSKPSYNFFPFVAKHGTVDTLVQSLMNGSVFFDEKGPSFLPFQVELIHELIHVLHNSQGRNMRGVSMEEHMKSLWGSYEEFMTIRGGDLCEAKFADAHGARPRKGHDASQSSVLFEPDKTTSIQKLSQDFMSSHNITLIFKDKMQTERSDSKLKEQNDRPNRLNR